MRKPSRKIIYSAIGTALAFVIIVALNVISSHFYFRADMTEDRMYTLSNSTIEIISRIEKPVTIRFYCTDNNTHMPTGLKSYSEKIEDLLAEYKAAGMGMIKIEKFDPVPYSDAEDSARMDGITGQVISTGDNIYMGIAVSCADRTDSIPFLIPERENILEYDITRAISSVVSEKKKIIGLISALPLLGGKTQPSPEMFRSGKYIPQLPWIPFKELQNEFEIRDISLSSSSIDKDIRVLMVIQPASISDETLFAIDQFLLGGGKLIVMLDPLSMYSVIKSPSEPENKKTISCTLPKLLEAWGVQFNKNIVIADMSFAQRLETPTKKITYATLLNIPSEGLNRRNIITGQLEAVSFAFAGAFSVKSPEGVEKEVLIHTTKDSMPVNSLLADKPEKIFRYFKPSSIEYELAVSLKGRFKTAFPDGPPKGKKDTEKKTKFLKESKNESMVALIGDTDFLVNDVCAQLSKDQFGRKFYLRKNDNINLLQNLVEIMSGDNTLIDIRCRQIIRRPFIKIEALKSKAEQEYKNKITELEKGLKETQANLNRLQKEKIDTARFILSPEQKKELGKFKSQAAKARKELKKLKKKLYKDIYRLENRIKWLNIMLIPVLVAAAGIIWSILRRRKGGKKRHE